MVELASKKRRFEHSSSPSFTENARYALPFLYSSLCYKQPLECLTCSPQSVVIAVPPQPQAPSMSAITGDLYSGDIGAKYTLIQKTPLRLMQQFHQHHAITHLEWNQRGTALASVDETGKLALWTFEGSVDQWSQIYNADLRQPLAALQWLNTDRSYEIQQGNFVRSAFHGPRNTHGHLAFVAVTIHGEISVYYQHNAGIFSTLFTRIPMQGRQGMDQQDVGCFGLALAGQGEWKRISHASMTIDPSGTIHLATHYSTLSSKIIHLYSLAIKFPTILGQGAVLCKSVTTLNLKSSSNNRASALSSDMRVTQLQLTRDQGELQVIVGFGNQDTVEAKDVYNGFLGRWNLQNSTRPIPSEFMEGSGYNNGSIMHQRMALKYKNGFTIPNCFITAMSSTYNDCLVLGLSDGSLHMEYRPTHCFGLAKSQHDQNQHSLDASFWQVIKPHVYSDGYPDPISGITVSPNHSHIIYMFSSGKFGTSRVTDHEKEKVAETVLVINQMIKLSLMNQVDNLDLISELVLLSQKTGQQDTAQNTILEALEGYTEYCNNGDLSTLSKTYEQLMTTSQAVAKDCNLSLQSRAYGLALATFRRLKGTDIQYTNLCKASQLPVVLECFIGSCTSDPMDIEKAFDLLEQKMKAQKSDPMIIEFDPDSLWSLVPLVTWTFDYVRWILKEWNLLFNTIRPKDSELADIGSQATHAVLLVHKQSRSSLYKILVMVYYFVNYSMSGNYELAQEPNSRTQLKNTLSTVLQSEPVIFSVVLAFIRALDTALDKEVNAANQWQLLLSSRIPANTIAELKETTRKCKSKCAPGMIYLEDQSGQRVDVIRKSRIPSSITHVRRCIRCHQCAMPATTAATDKSNIYASALWFRSIGSRCICGGIFSV